MFSRFGMPVFKGKTRPAQGGSQVTGEQEERSPGCCPQRRRDPAPAPQHPSTRTGAQSPAGRRLGWPCWRLGRGSAAAGQEVGLGDPTGTASPPGRPTLPRCSPQVPGGGRWAPHTWHFGNELCKFSQVEASFRSSREAPWVVSPSPRPSPFLPTVSSGPHGSPVTTKDELIPESWRRDLGLWTLQGPAEEGHDSKASS